MRKRGRNTNYLVNFLALGMKFYFKIRTITIRQFSLIFLVCFVMNASLSEAAEFQGRGCRALSEEQISHIEKHMHWVAHVKPNHLGRDRIHYHLITHEKDPVEFTVAETAEEEFTLHKGLPSEEVLLANHQYLGTTPLPSSVNNSMLPSFPPIGDQKNLGSCVAWGSTYYQATHEIGLLNGVDNKTNAQGILSPKWTYNLLNNGVDDGLMPLDAFQLLSQNGAISIVNFPYDSNYLQWDINTQDWVTAISSRMNPPQLIAGLGGIQPQNLTMIKQTLNNGHVVTFATYIDSWVFTTILQDPENLQNSYVGQYAAKLMNGTVGGHFMTIVGYDDNLWIDVNGNGKVDPGERGAFLVANSWGTGWGNEGFIWISYDAFKAISGVSKMKRTKRVPAGVALNSNVISITPKDHNYSPRLIAEFTLTQAYRNQISVVGGSSDTTVTVPTANFFSKALDNLGGPLEFDGSHPGAPETATFALDLTDLVPQAGGQRYYLTVGDNAASQPTTLTAFRLIDVLNNQQVEYENVPVSFDNAEKTFYLDYAFN